MKALILSLGVGALMVGGTIGCDRTVEKHETTRTRSDGSTETQSEEKTVKSDGTVETKKETEKTPPTKP